MNIKIYTRSINYELYKKSRHTISLPYPHKRLINTTGDGYFYQLFSDTNCDIAINIDEDAFVINDNGILELIEFMVKEEYIYCGMPDCITARHGNPIVTNPFFNIINIKKIREKLDRAEIDNFDYGKYKQELINRLPSNINCKNGSFEPFDIESYYTLFLWLAYHFKPLYLDADVFADGISTVLKNHIGHPIVLHSWYSREYRKDAQQTERIESLYKQACQIKGIQYKSPEIWRYWTSIDRKKQIVLKKIRNGIKKIL